MIYVSSSNTRSLFSSAAAQHMVVDEKFIYILSSYNCISSPLSRRADEIALVQVSGIIWLRARSMLVCWSENHDK